MFEGRSSMFQYGLVRQFKEGSTALWQKDVLLQEQGLYMSCDHPAI